jgi:adenylate kinase family enzyme
MSDLESSPTELALLFEMFLGGIESDDIDGATQVRNVIADQYPTKIKLLRTLDEMLEEKKSPHC